MARVRYTIALSEQICTQLTEGVSLRSICAAPGMPSVGGFLGWVSKNPKLAEQYARARALCMDAIAEQILEIADTPMLGVKRVTKPDGVETTEGDMTDHRKLQIDARKWLLAKLAPKKYGDKIETTLKGDPGAPVQLVVNGSDVHG